MKFYLKQRNKSPFWISVPITLSKVFTGIVSLIESIYVENCCCFYNDMLLLNSLNMILSSDIDVPGEDCNSCGDTLNFHFSTIKFYFVLYFAMLNWDGDYKVSAKH